MGKDSRITWTDHTFNPWIGCTKVSEGCKNCYAFADAKWSHCFGPDAERHITSDNYWKQPLKWNKEAGELGIRYKVFCGSYCDVFEDREDLEAVRETLGNLILKTENLDWLLLTKRPENIYNMIAQLTWVKGYPVGEHEGGEIEYNWYPYIPDNVWIGTTVENQKQADIRIPELLKIPAKVRFISAEPLLEGIDLYRWLICPVCNGDMDIDCWSCGGTGIAHHKLNWIIIGAESGANRRPMSLDAMVFLYSQAHQAGIPIFIKQGSAFKPGQQGDIPDWLWEINQFPEVEG